MKRDNQLISAGLLAAFGASLCCITPLLALVAGGSGIASTFSWVEPYRPYLIGLTVTVLVFAWYQKLKPRKEIYCECEPGTPQETEKRKITFIYSKSFLGLVSLFAIGMLVFPSYSHIFYPESGNEVIVVDQFNIKTVEFEVSGMTCAGCEPHITHEVNKLPGIINSKVSYADGNAIIQYDGTKSGEEEIEVAIQSTGYTVTGKKTVP